MTKKKKPAVPELTSGEKLRRLFDEYGVTVKDVAEQMEMEWSTLRNKLTSYRPWAYHEVIALTDALNDMQDDNEDPRAVLSYDEVLNTIGFDRVFVVGSLQENIDRGISIDGTGV